FAPLIGYDPMSGQPLRYQFQAGGTFLLYSVGEDGRDDGGNAKPSAGKTYGLWEGHDAVWPLVAPQPK
ncbi:MAG TPA: hypothetical protein VNZ22_02790, partial [Bacillota bacterium]|nr:hypothetical protein [Bacillota bacterium]